jgi:hypothetical protein
MIMFIIWFLVFLGVMVITYDNLKATINNIKDIITILRKK